MPSRRWKMKHSLTRAIKNLKTETVTRYTILFELVHQGFYTLNYDLKIWEYTLKHFLNKLFI